jgi:hypothetical protein
MVNKNNNIAIALLCRYPDNVWLNFLNNFNHYDIFVFIDDISKDFVNLFNIENSKIIFIQMPDYFCERYGYHNALIQTGNIPNKPLSWDKALFYFCELNHLYEHVWFIEDDVFFLKEDILRGIDNCFTQSDLLAPFNDVNTSGTHDGWTHWHMINGVLPLPWARSMVCACRLSNRLLKDVKDYVNHHHKLLYHEFMFNTIAYQKGYQIDSPYELSTIHFQANWDSNNLNLGNLYHPIKDIQVHNRLRCNNSIYFDNLFNNCHYNNANQFYFNEDDFWRIHKEN